MKSWFLALLLTNIASSLAAIASMQANPREAVVHTRHGATLSIPKTWHINTQDNLVQIVGPEKDFLVYVYAEDGVVDNNSRARELWHAMYPGAKMKTAYAQNLGTSWKWTTTKRFIFDNENNPGVIYEAYPHTVNKTTHWLLVEATVAAYSRRSADLAIILDSFRTRDMKAPSYAHRKIKQLSADDKEQLHQFLRMSLEKLKIPGCTFLVIDKQGAFLFEGAYGVRSVVTKEPITLDTPFMIGSVSKSLTSLLMARLVDQGVITWESKIKDLIKNFSTGSKELTRELDIRTSVSASTGMPRRDMEFIFEYKGTSATDRIAELAFMTPTTKKGETFQYSNHLVLVGGYAAAAAYAPHLSLTEAYETAMRELIFEPLGMKNTSVANYDPDVVMGAKPHALTMDNKEIELPISREEALFSIAPAGGGSSSARDLARYVLLELNNGVIDNKRIVSEAALLERRKPMIKASGSVHYGLGLFIEDFHGLMLMGHSGNTLGFSSSVFFLPAQGVGFVILTNMQGANGFMGMAINKFLELALGLPNRSNDQLQRLLKATEARHNLFTKYFDTSASANEWMTQWVGTYRNPRLGVVEIRKKHNGIGYELDAGEWQSDLQILVNAKTRSLLLTKPPFHLEFVPDAKSRSLFLTSGQETYQFKEHQRP